MTTQISALFLCVLVGQSRGLQYPSYDYGDETAAPYQPADNPDGNARKFWSAAEVPRFPDVQAMIMRYPDDRRHNMLNARGRYHTSVPESQPEWNERNPISKRSSLVKVLFPDAPPEKIYRLLTEWRARVDDTGDRQDAALLQSLLSRGRDDISIGLDLNALAHMIAVMHRQNYVGKLRQAQAKLGRIGKREYRPL